MDQFIQAYELCKENKALNESLIKALDEASIKTLIDICKKNNKDVSLASLKPPSPKPEDSNKTLKEILDEDLLKACLEKACKWGDLEHVQYLIKQGAADRLEENPLYFWNAIEGRHMTVVQYLVEVHGLDINAFDGRALNKASFIGCFEIVKYLVERGAVITDSVVRFAASNYQFKIMKYLMETYNGSP